MLSSTFKYAFRLPHFRALRPEHIDQCCDLRGGRFQWCQRIYWLLSLVPRGIMFLTLIVLPLVGLCLIAASVAKTPMYLHVETSTGNDTLMVGVAGSVIFRADSAQDWGVITAFSWPLVWSFSNGNIVGPLSEQLNVLYSPLTLVAFEQIVWDSSRGIAATDPDTTILNLIDFGGTPEWSVPGDEVWRITFVPIDAGTIHIDSLFLPPSYYLTVLDAHGSVEIVWEAASITVVPYCRVELDGDIDMNTVISASDIILLVNFVFKSGPSPLPCEATGDVDCSGSVTASDILMLVGYVFKAGSPPCNVCELINSGAWSCD